MNTKTFDAGFKAMNATLNTACSIARSTKSSALNTKSATTSFFAGMAQAVKVRNGKCLMLTHEE